MSSLSSERRRITQVLKLKKRGEGNKKKHAQVRGGGKERRKRRVEIRNPIVGKRTKFIKPEETCLVAQKKRLGASPRQK